MQYTVQFFKDSHSIKKDSKKYGSKDIYLTECNLVFPYFLKPGRFFFLPQKMKFWHSSPPPAQHVRSSRHRKKAAQINY